MACKRSIEGDTDTDCDENYENDVKIKGNTCTGDK